MKLAWVRNTVSPNAYAVEFVRKAHSVTAGSLWGPYRRDHSTYITEIWNMHNARDAITSMVITNPNGGGWSGLAFEENVLLTSNPFFYFAGGRWGGDRLNWQVDEEPWPTGHWISCLNFESMHVGGCLNKTCSLKLHRVLCQKYLISWCPLWCRRNQRSYSHLSDVIGPTAASFSVNLWRKVSLGPRASRRRFLWGLCGIWHSFGLGMRLCHYCRCVSQMQNIENVFKSLYPWILIPIYR